MVIDEDDLPGETSERGFQSPKQRGDVIALVESRNDNRKLEHRNDLRRALGDGFVHAVSVYPIASGEAKGKPSQSAIAKKRVKKDQNSPKKCQRPRTEGARTSGAAELFSGRPGAGAIKHRRRRSKSHKNDRGLLQGRP